MRAALILTFALTGCAVGKNNRVGLATVNSQGEVVATQPPAATSARPSIVEAVRALVGEHQAVTAIVTGADVPRGVPPIARGLPPQTEESRETVSLPVSTDRGVMVWVNPHGEKYHRDPSCRFVCRSGDQRPYCKGKPSATIPLGLAINQERPPCNTCGGGTP